MFGAGIIISIIICLVAFGTQDWNFGGFGMPKTGVKKNLYLAQYKYVKEKGQTSFALSLLLGSLGMIPLSVIMAVTFFFINGMLYLGLIMGAQYTYGKFYIIPIFVSVRIFNAIVVYVYMKLRLKFIEKDLMTFLYEGEMEEDYKKNFEDDYAKRGKDSFKYNQNRLHEKLNKLKGKNVKLKGG